MWVDAFKRPVTDDPWTPVAALLARQNEAADRHLSTLVVSMEQIHLKRPPDGLELLTRQKLDH